MEAFEHLVKVMLETKGYVVTTNVKFPATIKTKNGQVQRHGYEVDVVAAKHNSLLLGSVKSFLGSRGVNRDGFVGTAKPDSKDLSGYKLFNRKDIREKVFHEASKRYGYPVSQIQLKLYVGKFAPGLEDDVRKCLKEIVVGAGCGIG